MDINIIMLNRAIVLYIGVGVNPYPSLDEKRIYDNFGQEPGLPLKNKAVAILHELYELYEINTANHSSGDLEEFERVRSEMEKKHPELDKEAMDALLWAYSWWCFK